MQFNRDASVFSDSGEDLGRLDRVVLEPKTGVITHIVVRRGWFFKEDRVVPIEMVRSASENEIHLAGAVEDPEEFPLFEETHYVNASTGEVDSLTEEAQAAAPPVYWYPPASVTIGFPAYYRMPFALETETNIPEGTVPLKEDARVLTAGGDEVGRVERLFTDDQGLVTHFLVSSGILGTRKRLIPTHWISTVAEEEIELSVRSELVERLPDFEE